MSEHNATVFALVWMVISLVITAVIFSGVDDPNGILVLVVWMIVAIVPVVLVRYSIDDNKKNSVQSIITAANNYFKNNNLYLVSQDSVLRLETSNYYVMVVPVKNKNGVLYLTIWDAIGNTRIVIRQGNITGYRLDINGTNVNAVGGSLFGFGMVKGGVTDIDSVEMVIMLRNMNAPSVRVRLGKHVYKNEFDKVQSFVDNFESLMNHYM